MAALFLEIMHGSEMLMERLSQAERLAEGKMHVERQRTLVENLALDGHDTTTAAALLQRFEETLALHIEDRDRLAGSLRVQGCSTVALTDSRNVQRRRIALSR
jgi:hypothetical protein